MADGKFEYEFEIRITQLHDELRRLNQEVNNQFLTKALRNFEKFTGESDKAATSIKRAKDATRGWTTSMVSGYRDALQEQERLNKARQEFVQNNLRHLGGQYDVRPIEDSNRRVGDSFLEAGNNARTGAKRILDAAPSIRYAMYDIASTATIAGVALTGLGAAVYGVSIAWERDFANVIRTTDLRGQIDRIQTLRENFQDLAGTIPVAANEIAEIGTLGGQLGVMTSNLTSFVSVVARTSATTDIAVGDAATYFGRLTALLPELNQGAISLEQFASAILATGTSSVATEGDIARTAVQIAAMGNLAGFTSADIIGLSSALASIGVRPELARGTITRLFTYMSQAASNGSARLQEFARISNVSAQEFADAWGTPEFTDIFVGFIEGLSTRTDDANAALISLGVNSVRDRPALLRLAEAAAAGEQGVGLLAQQVRIANEEIVRGQEIQEQYGVIAETVASKLQILQNNVVNLFAAIGGGGAIFGGLLDALNGVLRGLTEIAQHPVGSAVLQLGLILTGVVGVLFLMTGALAGALAGWLAMQFVMKDLGLQSAGFGISLKALEGTLLGLGVNARFTAVALGAVRVALNGLKFGAIAAAAAGVTLGLGALANGFFDWANGIDRTTDAANGFPQLMRRLTTETSEVDGAIRALQENNGFETWGYQMNRAFENIGLRTDQGTADIKQLDDALAGMVASGNLADAYELLTEFAQAQHVSTDELIDTYLPELRNQLALAGQQAGATADQMAIVAQEEYEAEVRTLELATALGLVGEEFETFKDNITTGSGAFFDFGDIMKGLQDESKTWAEEQAKATETSKDSWEDFYDGSSVAIDDFMLALEDQIVAQEAWAADLQELSARGASFFVSELSAMGPEGAAVAAQAVNLTTEELNKLEANARLAAFLSSEAFAEAFTENTPALIEAYRQGGIEAVQALIQQQIEDGEGVPTGLQQGIDNAPTPLVDVGAYTDPARASIDRLITWTNNRVATIDVYSSYKGGSGGGGISGGGGGGGGGGGFASGGPVYGPGSGTSDSVYARLSNGEYVIKAASVQKYGQGLFDALNRGVARFANGGPVGRIYGDSIPTVATSVTNVNVTQNYPTTRDPIKKMKSEAESIMAGIWS